MMLEGVLRIVILLSSFTFINIQKAFTLKKARQEISNYTEKKIIYFGSRSNRSTEDALSNPYILLCIRILRVSSLPQLKYFFRNNFALITEVWYFIIKGLLKIRNIQISNISLSILGYNHVVSRIARMNRTHSWK